MFFNCLHWNEIDVLWISMMSLWNAMTTINSYISLKLLVYMHSLNIKSQSRNVKNVMKTHHSKTVFFSNLHRSLEMRMKLWIYMDVWPQALKINFAWLLFIICDPISKKQQKFTKSFWSRIRISMRLTSMLPCVITKWTIMM